MSDREVAEKAWDECWRRIMLTDSEVEAVNPYRATPDDVVPGGAS